MRKILITMLMVTLGSFCGYAAAQETEVPTATEAQQFISSQGEETLKERLISESGVPERVQPALRDAARAMSYETLKEYLAHPHHAYDGHSVLDHARMKVRFAAPLMGKPCPDCGKKIYLFGEGKTEDAARRHGLALLAQMPVDPALAQLVDEGRIEDMNSGALEPVVDVMTAPRG